MATSSGSNVQVDLPVKIDYPVLDLYLQKKFKGKVLSKAKANGETADHARVQHIAVAKSKWEDFDLEVHLRLQLLTTFFRDKEIDVVVHLALAFDRRIQELTIENYELDGGSNSWVVNQLLETLINRFLYKKLKEKMKVDLQPVLDAQIGKLNKMLSDGTEVKQGIFLSGSVKNFQVTEIVAGQKCLLVSLHLTSTNVVNVKELDF
jgi:hypothetical protein